MRKLWDLLRNKIGTKHLILWYTWYLYSSWMDVEFYCMARGFGG